MPSATHSVVLTLRSVSTPKPWARFRTPLAYLVTLNLGNQDQCSHPRAISISSTRTNGRSQSGTVQDLSQKALDKEESSIEDSIAQEKGKQQRAPWHREGSNVPPVARPRSAGAMTKGMTFAIPLECIKAHDSLGKLLTTPSRLLKLIIPLTTMDKNTDRKDVEPLALLGQS